MKTWVANPEQLKTCLDPVQSWNPVRDAPNDEIAYIDLGAVDNDRKVIGSVQRILGKDAPSRARQRVQAGDILVSTVRPYLNGVARVPVELDGATASTGFCVIRANEARADPAYLFHWVQSPSFISDMIRRSTGASYPAVSDKIIEQSLIPLPSPSEQKRIARILNQVREIDWMWGESLRQLDRLRNSYLDAACAREGGAKPLTAIFSDIKMGPFGSLLHKSDYVEDGVPLINPMHIASGKIFPDPAYAVSFEKMEVLSAYRLEEEDVVIGRRGEMGRSALVLKESAGMLCGTGSMRLRVDPKMAIPEFVADFLAHPKTVRELENAASGVTMLNLSSKTFDKIPVKLPSLDIQREYVDAKARIRMQTSIVELGATQAHALSTSLQHRAFRGEL